MKQLLILFLTRLHRLSLEVPHCGRLSAALDRLLGWLERP